MSEPGDKSTEDGAIDVRAGELAPAVRSQIGEGARARAADPPPLALRRTDSLESERRALLESIEALRDRMSHYGEVTTTRPGLAGRLELTVKRALRRLVQRHLDQERDVHDALHNALQCLSALLEAEHDLIDENSIVLTDQSVRRDHG